MPSVPDRFERQRDLVPRAALEGLTALVVGVGAIGRQVALQLAAVGARRMRLVDFDRVEPTNVTTQGYPARDVGAPKVEATARAARDLEPELEVTLITDRFRPAHLVPGAALFCCVDSISARAAVWRASGRRVQFWCDGRMAGEVARVLTVAGPAGAPGYGASLFAQSEAHAGRCAARATVYAANVAAGLMVHQFARWLRGLPVDADVSLNLLASELCVA